MDKEIFYDSDFGIAVYFERIEKVKKKDEDNKEEYFIDRPIGLFEHNIKKNKRYTNDAYFVNRFKPNYFV